MAAPPPGFVDLNTALKRPKLEFNIMGVVTDFMVPGRSRGTDWMSSFSITDSSYSILHDGGFKVRFFRPMESELPAIKGLGDVVVLRGIKIHEWSGMTIGLSTRTTSWVIFPVASIPATVPVSGLQLKNVKEPRAPNPSDAEMRYAVSLCNSQDRSAFTEPFILPAGNPVASSQNTTSSARISKRDKFSLIKDIKVETYYDLVGQVVRIYAHNNRVELYMTDYTSNSLLFNYEWGQDDVDGSGREGDVYNYAPRHSTARKWPGPPGYRTLTVTLFPPHSYFAQQTLKETDFVHLRNVHVKWSKDSKIEGVLHSDRRYPDRIDIAVLDPNERDDRVKDVLRRKRDLAKQFPTQRDEFIAQARAHKRKEIDEDKPLSKTAAKKKRKLERERLENKKTGETRNLDNKENSASGTGLASKARAEKASPLVDTNKDDMNKNVHCGHHLITLRSLSSILSLDTYTNTTPNGISYNLPFQNINSRAFVRVIDFFPSELADFAAPCAKPSEYDILSEPEESEDGSGSEISAESNFTETATERRWEWRFGFILEDALGPKNEAKATMEVYVVGEDAECLLKLDAENLHKSPTALAKLREKLFLLWGDLEEWKLRKSLTLKQVDGNSRSPKKEQTPKGRPFQCCIKEYGVKKRLKRTIEEVDDDSGNDGGSEDDSQRKQDFNDLMSPKQPPPSKKKPHSDTPKSDPARTTTFLGRDGLGAYITNPASFPASRVIYHDDKWVVINDLFPKSSIHVLLLPRDPSKQLLHPFDAFEDTNFLSEVQAEVRKVRILVAKELHRRFGKFSALDRKRQKALDELDPSTDTEPADLPPGRDWSASIISGIHAGPSMNHLHVHILSIDRHSECMRHRKHYNSFSTPFLIGVEDFPLDKQDPRRHAGRERYLERDLVCWRCQRNFGNKFAKLKAHLDEESEVWRKE